MKKKESYEKQRVCYNVKKNLVVTKNTVKLKIIVIPQ